MGARLEFLIRKALPGDADALLALYAAIYGPNYPLPFGTDRAVMLRTMQTELWLVAVNAETGHVGGSVVVEADYVSKIGKVAGLVVDERLRGQNLGLRLVSEGTTQLFAEGKLNSIYATTRTFSVGVQKIFLKDGFLPLGILPNAHRLREHETLTLFAKYREGVLDRRRQLEEVPGELDRILDVVFQRHQLPTPGTRLPSPKFTIPSATPFQFELIFAQNYVARRFDATMGASEDYAFPLHRPNLLLSSTDGTVEIYAFFSKKDRYCAIVGVNVPVETLDGRLFGLLDQLKDLGVSYIEILLGLHETRSLEVTLQAGFVPSAMYPAMREKQGVLHDFMVLSRTLEPLNFRGMTIDQSFKPFIDQYIYSWTQKHLMTLEVHGTQ